MKNTTYQWHSSVRDYELDSQGIVNHAIYINYLEQARNDYARSLGLDFNEYYKAGYHFVITAIEIEYRKPLGPKNEFYVTATITSFDEKRIHFEQEIKLNGTDKLIAKAIVHTACIDYKTGKSCMPDVLRKFLVGRK